MKKSILYWGPFIDSNIATVKAMYNSAIAINKYSEKYKISIINTVGEWNQKKNDNQSLEFIDLNLSNLDKLPKHGFIKSRVSYWIIFIKSFFPLKKLLMEKKPEFLIIHLLVSLPMLLFVLFKFKTKLILRISGKPKLNILRILIWKIASNKINMVFCPTEETRNHLIKNRIFEPNKIFLLYDPVINLKNFVNLKKNNEVLDDRFQKGNIILVGRLTKQKNFNLIIEACKKNDRLINKFKIFIFGEGEQEKYLKNKVRRYKLENKIIFLGYKKNIYKYMATSKIFISTSLWEDPGFVLVEAAMNNLTILSSNCSSGPKEIINKNELGGYLFDNNDSLSLNKKLNFLIDDNEINIFKKKLYVKRNIMNFTLFRHSKILQKHLNSSI